MKFSGKNIIFKHFVQKRSQIEGSGLIDPEKHIFCNPSLIKWLLHVLQVLKTDHLGGWATNSLYTETVCIP